MASANDCSFESFKLPPEPSPLTSVVDEQDSFVILWEDGHTNIIQEVNKKHINSNDSKDTDKTAIENQSDMEQVVNIYYYNV